MILPHYDFEMWVKTYPPETQQLIWNMLKCKKDMNCDHCESKKICSTALDAVLSNGKKETEGK